MMTELNDKEINSINAYRSLIQAKANRIEIGPVLVYDIKNGIIRIDIKEK